MDSIYRHYIYFSTQPKAINPRRRVKNKDLVADDDEDGESVKASRDPDKIDPWGDNPEWDPHWVKAHKINYLGRVRWTDQTSKET